MVLKSQPECFDHPLQALVSWMFQLRQMSKLSYRNVTINFLIFFLGMT